MADMAVFITNVSTNDAGIHLTCLTMTSDMIPGDGINFVCDVGWNKTQAKANAQIQDDAIATLFSERGIVVGANDNKILIAGVGGW